MTLAEFIREIGPAEFARRFGVKERTAFSYLYDERRPHRKLAQKIVDNSPVDWAGIYAGASKLKPN